MSLHLHFPQDQLSKREKQEIFKRSLDDQRRIKQEASAQQQQHPQLPSNTGDQERHVPGLAAPSPADVMVPRLNHIPGLDQHQAGYAPRFEGSPSPEQEKQPYMSALSEMNGRPLHIRQQQFQKESQYRNMLKDQIAENKKRKDAEKAKLAEEKRRELEEIRRLQGISAPRRQQHKQFQESPDHPLPSPGRFPPAVHNPASNPHPNPELQLRRPVGNAGSQNYTQPEEVTPVHASSGGYSARNPPGINGLVGNERWQGQRNAPDGLGGDRRRTYSERQEQPRAAAYPNDFAADSRQDPTSQPARTAAPSRPYPYGGDGQETGTAGRTLDRFGNSAQALSGEGAARKLAVERGGAAGEAESASDSVPRADFDELSNLCRDLLHEQKQLRQRLEEREERERLAAERSAQQEEATRQQQQQQQQHRQQRGGPRRGGGRSLPNQGASSSSNSDGRRRVPTSVRESALRQDQRAKPKPKPGVAFGSSRPRMPGPTVDKPRVTANPKPRASGGGHDRRARVSRSEPIPATATATAKSLETRHRQTRSVGSTSRDVSGGRGEKLSTNPEPSDSGWPKRNATQGARGDAKYAENGRFAGPDRHLAVGSEWTPRENPVPHSPEMLGGGGISTIHSLLTNAGGAARHGVASRESEPRPCGDGDELGGESTFLAAHPMDSGLVSSQEEGLGLVGRGTTGHFKMQT
eukprot:g8981.t1